jgi:hypothetical protein
MRESKGILLLLWVGFSGADKNGGEQTAAEPIQMEQTDQ